MTPRTIGLAGALVLALTGPSIAAEAPYPFEGVWVRAERACTPTTVRERTYTAREVVSPRGRCAIRRVAQGAPGTYELLEECRRTDHQGSVTETIKMTSSDTMTLKRQVSRLKIPRQVRYARCTVAPNAPAAAPLTRAPRTAPAPGATRDKQP